jgi:predicted TIM-barrel fold metal-dependent hydrolase
MIEIAGRQVRVIDSHVHVFPDDVSSRRADWLLRDAWFRELYENPRSRLATVEDLVQSMDGAGVDHSILCGFPWADEEHCRYHNEYMADCAKRFPDRLSWLGIVAPGDHAAELASLCFERGAVGIGELNADAQGIRWSSCQRMAPLASLCIGMDRPWLVHASEPVGHRYPGKGLATPDEINALAIAFPELRIVAAHWGGGLPFYELMPRVRAQLERVAYDSAATTYLYDFRVFRQALDIVGPAKVMFASDYPVLRQDRLLERVRGLDWTELEADAVFHRTATNIFRLENER